MPTEPAGKPGQSGYFGPPRARARRWLAAVAIFAAGALAVGLPVGLLTGGNSGGGGPAASASSGPPSSGAAGQVSVNASCVEAIHDAQTVRTQLNSLALAAQRLNFGQLDQVVRKLEPIQSRLSADSHACRIVTQLPNGTAVTSRPAVPPSPAATPASPGSGATPASPAATPASPGGAGSAG